MAFSLAKLIEERQADQYDLHMKYLSPHMARVQKIIGFDKIYTRGEGAYLWDADGNRYLDLLAGYSVFNLGRGHPALKQAMLEFLSLERPTLVKMDCPLLAGLLAEELVKRMPPGLDAIFFANSGADAVDTALKFARYATKRPRIVYLDHAFHGLTLGTLSINGGEAFKKGFEPLIPGAAMVKMNDLEALERELRKGDVAAFIVEPIQGKGVYIPDDNYLPEAQRLCQVAGWRVYPDQCNHHAARDQPQSLRSFETRPGSLHHFWTERHGHGCRAGNTGGHGRRKNRRAFCTGWRKTARQADCFER
jgi:ornithine--oxo-acid transaminase